MDSQLLNQTIETILPRAYVLHGLLVGVERRLQLWLLEQTQWVSARRGIIRGYAPVRVRTRPRTRHW